MKAYNDAKNVKIIERTRALLAELPTWAGDYIRACESTTSPLTRLNYTFDLRVFLYYLVNEHPLYSGMAVADITTNMLDKLTLRDLEVYIEYLSYYKSKDGEREKTNTETGKARKIASLRSCFRHLFKHDLLRANYAELLATPKIKQKEIVRLTSEEASNIIAVIRSGEGLTPRQREYQKKTILRDIAICIMFLTTGIRVSELVGLNISDLDFDNRSFIVTRKGGNRVMLFFEEETENALLEYLIERRSKGDISLGEPLFTSMQNKRINVKSVENLVKKYAQICTPLKNITPHKLRSTYGTMLYEETGDIYLVAEVLGHKDVNTTRKHYAAISETRRRSAAGLVKIESDD